MLGNSITATTLAATSVALLSLLVAIELRTATAYDPSDYNAGALDYPLGEDDDGDGGVYDEEGRLIIVPVGTAGLGGVFNFTSALGPFLLALASAVVTLLGLTALGFLIWSLVAGKYGYGGGFDPSYGSGGYGDSGAYSSYTSFRR